MEKAVLVYSLENKCFRWGNTRFSCGFPVLYIFNWFLSVYKWVSDAKNTIHVVYDKCSDVPSYYMLSISLIDLSCFLFFTECGTDSESWQLRSQWANSKKENHVILSSSHVVGVWPQAVYQISLIPPQTARKHSQFVSKWLSASAHLLLLLNAQGLCELHGLTGGLEGQLWPFWWITMVIG